MDKYGNLDYEEIMSVLAKQDARLAALGVKKVKKGNYAPLKDQISRFERVSE